MAWKIELETLADKELGKIDPQVRRRILRFLFDRVALLEDPRSIGDALAGAELGEYWKYRVGDYRIIAYIDDKKIIITVVKIGNRKEVYR
jgi:mRNA interferase RelE/StbE